MRANISEDLIKLIDKKILLDLQIHILNRKYDKAEKEGNKGYTEYIDKVIKKVIARRKEVKEILNINNIKIFDPVSDDEFVEYKYYQKLKSGGIAEGSMRYWKAALKLRLKKMTQEYWR